MIFQEEYYFKTIWEINVFGYNIWEINRLLPSLILFILLSFVFLISQLIVRKVVKAEVKQNNHIFFNALNSGIIAFLSALIIYIILYINFKDAYDQKIITEFKITGYDMMSGGDSRDDFPSIFINSGYPNKRLIFRQYTKEFVYSKKQACLTLKKGKLGYLIITDIKLK
jgi:hypothetical protein